MPSPGYKPPSVTWKIKSDVHRNVQRTVIDIRVYAQSEREVDRVEIVLKSALAELEEGSAE